MVVSQASFWLHLRDRSACSFKHIKGLPGVPNQGAASSGPDQDPSPAASSGSSSTSGGDGSPTPATQASSESPSSGNRTSSGAGADETTPTGKGVAASIPVSNGKAKAKQVRIFPVYMRRLRPFDVCLRTELNCSANMACIIAHMQLVFFVIDQ